MLLFSKKDLVCNIEKYVLCKFTISFPKNEPIIFLFGLITLSKIYVECQPS